MPPLNEKLLNAIDSIVHDLRIDQATQEKWTEEEYRDELTDIIRKLKNGPLRGRGEVAPRPSVSSTTRRIGARNHRKN